MITIQFRYTNGDVTEWACHSRDEFAVQVAKDRVMLQRNILAGVVVFYRTPLYGFTVPLWSYNAAVGATAYPERS